NFSGANGMLISPHHTSFSVIASLTINLSFGDLPVNFPVFTDTAPKDDNSPNPCSTVILLNVSGESWYLTFVLLIPYCSSGIVSVVWLLLTIFHLIIVDGCKGK